MKKRSWKRFAALALAVIMALFAVACSSVPAKTDDTAENQGNQREMTVWIAKTFNDSADKQLAERIKSFAEVDDRVSKVNVETFAGSEGQSKWNAAIESGNVPDVSFLVAAPYANFSEMGLLEDLSDVIRDIEGNLGALYPAVREDMTSDSGEIYAVPISNSASMLHYRTDYFEKAGITSPPANWEEMELVCEKLKAANPDVYPFGHCISSSDDSEAQNLWILRSFGGRLWDENGNVAVNSPETIKAVNYIVGLYEKGYIPKSTIEWDSSGNNKSFLSGESAMAMNPGTLYNEIINGDMKDTLGKTTAIAPLPLGDYETWKEPGRNMLSVFKGARDVELSKDLIRYVFEPEWYDEYMVNAEAAVLKALGYDPRPEAEAPEDEFLGEDELAARFRAELLGTEDFFICGDFDGDDTLEAFGGSSEPDGSNWWKKLHVYYVDNRGSVTEVENACPEKGVFLTDSADGTTTMLDFGTKRLLDIGYYPATAIGSCGVMVGVRDGKAYVPQGMRDILVEEIEGLYVYVGSFVWSDGEPQMEEHSYLFDEATGEFILLQEEEQEITIRFDYRTDQSKGSWTEEYAIISGIDADGNTLWTRETEHLGLTESTHIRSIGISGELYYYADDGITAIRVKDGAFVWKNIDVYTPCAFAIGEDGTIYLCCHYDLDFAAIDKYGNTLAHITALAPDSLWPDKIEIEGDKVKITETYNDNKVFYVDRNTFEVTR